MARSEQIASLFASVGFKIDQQSLKSLNKGLSDIEKKVQALQNAIKGVKLSRSTNAFKGLDSGAEKAAKAIEKLNNQYSSGVGPLQAYTSATQQLAAAMLQLKGVGPVRLPRTPAGGGAAPAAGAGSGFFSGMFGGLMGGGAATFARGIMPGLGAGWAVLHATQNARKTIATENALAALTGGQGSGAAEFQYVKDFSNTYGLKASESADAYKRILASSVGTKLQGAGARSIFEGTSLYGKTLGLSNENMARASTAISQMISKGKISSEELKGQLAEALPGAVQIFAKAMDVPVAQMFKMMEEGKVLSEDVLPKVAELLKQQAKAGGALEKSMKSSLSAQNRFLNKWEDFLKRLFESGMDEALASVFNGLTVALSGVSDILIQLGKAARFIFVPIQGLVALFKELPGVIQAALVGLAALKVFMAIGAWSWLKSHPLVIFFSLIFLLLEDFWSWTQGRDSLFGRLFGEWKPDFLDPVFEAFDKLIDYFTKAIKLKYELLRTASDKTSTFIGDVVDIVKGRDQFNPDQAMRDYVAAKNARLGSTTNQQVSVVVYAAPGQNAKELAAEVANRVKTSFPDGQVAR